MGQLDRPMAGFAAFAVAFAFWTAPEPLLARLLPALDEGSRLPAGFAAGAATFLLVTLLFSQLGSGRQSVPTRAPLSAVLELGTPPAEIEDIEPAPGPVRARDGESVAELMQRLEQALERAGGPAEPTAGPASDDERLRDAVEQLQRLAAPR